jgi:hypothetical protein
MRCFFCTAVLVKLNGGVASPGELRSFEIVRYPKTARKGGRFTVDNTVPSCRRCSRSGKPNLTA